MPVHLPIVLTLLLGLASITSTLPVSNLRSTTGFKGNTEKDAGAPKYPTTATPVSTTSNEAHTNISPPPLPPPPPPPSPSSTPAMSVILPSPSPSMAPPPSTSYIPPTSSPSTSMKPTSSPSASMKPTSSPSSSMKPSSSPSSSMKPSMTPAPTPSASYVSHSPSPTPKPSKSYIPPTPSAIPSKSRTPQPSTSFIPLTPAPSRSITFPAPSRSMAPSPIPFMAPSQSMISVSPSMNMLPSPSMSMIPSPSVIIVPSSSIAAIPTPSVSLMLSAVPTPVSFISATASTSENGDPSASPIDGGPLEIPDSGATVEEDAVCFPASATVYVRGRGAVRMDALTVGDEVLVATPSSSGETYSSVFMFTHAMRRTEADFLRLGLHDGRTLVLTPGHYLYVSGALRTARTARVGDFVEYSKGTQVTISKITVTRDVGLYNPQTLHGDIVVNGIRVSTYTEAISPSVAHALLAPFRGVFARLALTTSMLHNGVNNPIRYLAHLNSYGAL